MKLMKLFAVLALAGISNVAFGYTVKFKNKTDKSIYPTIGINCKSQLPPRPYDGPIMPNNVLPMAIDNGCYLSSVKINGQEIYKGSLLAVSETGDTHFDITGTSGNYKLSYSK